MFVTVGKVGLIPHPGSKQRPIILLVVGGFNLKGPFTRCSSRSHSSSGVDGTRVKDLVLSLKGQARFYPTSAQTGIYFLLPLDVLKGGKKRRSAGGVETPALFRQIRTRLSA